MEAELPSLTGVPFHKMSGSGNDFVFLDGRVAELRALENTDAVTRLCRRGTGIGADGVVWLLPSDIGAFRMRYRNSDGSIADMCGNAALCSVRLAVELGMAPASGQFVFETDSGVVAGEMRSDGLPQITLGQIRDVSPTAPVAAREGETRIGFANPGVPHLVVEVPDTGRIDLPSRGRELRFDPALGSAGANVNFVSRVTRERFRMRTYERGVEGETLACGTGAVACLAVISAWTGIGAATLETASKRELLVSLHEAGGYTKPSLAGEGRIVYSGTVSEL